MLSSGESRGTFLPSFSVMQKFSRKLFSLSSQKENNLSLCKCQEQKIIELTTTPPIHENNKNHQRIPFIFSGRGLVLGAVRVHKKPP